ncbi:hypothetical protein [Planktotalea sp.]
MTASGKLAATPQFCCGESEVMLRQQSPPEQKVAKSAQPTFVAFKRS